MNIENAILRYKDYGKNVKLIDRDVNLSTANFINSLIGPRRAGKSSIMLIYMNKLYKENKKVIFINGEDIDFEGLTLNDLDKIEIEIRRIYNVNSSDKVYLFIDEVQNFPNWSKWMRTLFDENLYNLSVSGSTSELSQDQLPIELRGRSIETLVLPFSFKEYCKAKKITYEKYLDIEKFLHEDSNNEFINNLNSGFFLILYLSIRSFCITVVYILDNICFLNSISSDFTTSGYPPYFIKSENAFRINAFFSKSKYFS